MVGSASEPAAIGGQVDEMTTDRRILFLSLICLAVERRFSEPAISGQVDELTTDRRFLFFFTFLSGRREAIPSQ